MITNIKNSVFAATTLSFVSLLATSDRAHAIALNFSTFTIGGDATLNSATSATIRSGNGLTLITGGGTNSLEAFLGIPSGAFVTLFPDNQFGSAIKQSLLVANGDSITFNYNFTQDPSDVAFITIGTDVSLLANSTGAGTFTFNFITSGNVDLGIGVLDITDSLGTSNLEVTSAAAAVPFEFEASGGLLILGGFFLGKRYLRNKKQ